MKSKRKSVPKRRVSREETELRDARSWGLMAPCEPLDPAMPGVCDSYDFQVNVMNQ